MASPYALRQCKSSIAKKASEALSDIFSDTAENIDVPLACKPNTLSPRELLSNFDRRALSSTDFSAIIRQLENEQPGLDWCCALDDLVKNEGLDLETAWAVMLSWLTDKLNDNLSLSRQAHRILRRALAALDDSQQKTLRAKIDAHFANLTPESWS